jgi:uncharacterized protein DUF4166
MTMPLYRRLLGERFERLPARVRELHDVTGASVWTGRADVERGRSLPSRMVATLFGLPPDGRDQTLRVTFQVDGDREIWSRVFGKAVFRSVQYERGGLLRERVGPSTFVFALETSADGMALKLRAVRFLGVPLPRFLAPSVRTFESERDGRYQFEVEASLPLLGRIVQYVGWLEKAD